MTQPAQQQGKLIYSSAHWKIYEQDAGMGERDYAVMINDIFYCRTEDSQTAMKIVESIRSRPAPSPQQVETISKSLALELCMAYHRERKATIRNATLELFDICLQEEGFLVVDQDEPVVLVSDVKRLIESLRTHPQEPKP